MVRGAARGLGFQKSSPGDSEAQPRLRTTGKERPRDVQETLWLGWEQKRLRRRLRRTLKSGCDSSRQRNLGVKGGV